MTTRTQLPACIPPLVRTGISLSDALALRKIAMTLHSWHEAECGFANYCIEREGENQDGRPFTRWSDGRKGGYVPDREAGAIKRLKAIMALYPTLGYFIQSDPRGASLYILRPGDVPEGADPSAYYSRGLPVYK